MSKVTSKRVLVPGIAVVAVLAAGGIFWAVSGDGDDLSRDDRERAEAAAVEEVGSGRAVDADVDDDTDEGGSRLYDVEVVDADGLSWDVLLDEDFEVISSRADDDGRGDRGDDGQGSGAGAVPSADPSASSSTAPGTAPTGDADDQPISDEERAQVAAAAEAAVEGGTAVDVDRSDDAGEAFEVEVRDAQNQDWDVTLDADLGVISAVRD